jgi:hypothetical protein
MHALHDGQLQCRLFQALDPLLSLSFLNPPCPAASQVHTRTCTPHHHHIHALKEYIVLPLSLNRRRLGQAI